MIGCKKIGAVSRRAKLILTALVGFGLTTVWAGHIELMGYPTKEATYKFEVSTGAKDKWDAFKVDEPPLAPGKAIRIATKFVQMVPVQKGMKGWRLNNVELHQMSYAGGPAEWIYIVHFDAEPDGNWNGPTPWIAVPVRLDGAVPEPTITKSP
jgi:hypothetical protein